MARHRPVQIGRGGDERFKGVEFQRGYGRFEGIAFQRGNGYTIIGMRFGRAQKFRNQNGRGWLSRIMGKIAPHFLKGAKTVGKHLLASAGDQVMNTGMQFLDDVTAGENVLKSAQHRLKEGGNKLLNTAKTQLMNDGMVLAKGLKRKLANYQKSQQGSGSKKSKTCKMKGQSIKKVIRKSNVKEAARGPLKKCSKLPYRHIFEF